MIILGADYTAYPRSPRTHSLAAKLSFTII